MGTWGHRPWQDDLAADWFADLFHKGKLVDRVVKTLQRKDVAEYWSEIRAAAYVVVALGDVWPADRLVADHERAIAALEAVKRSPELDGDNYLGSEIDGEIAALRDRLKRSAAPAAAPEEIPPQYDPTDAFRRLTDADPAVRLGAVKWIGKQAYGESNRWTDPWLRDPGTTEALLPLLADADPQVVEETLSAVRGIRVEGPRDERLFAPAVRLLRSERPLTRRLAVLLLAEFDAERCLDALLPLFADRDKAVRSVAFQVIGNQAGGWSEAAKVRLRDAALTALADRTDEVRYYAAATLANGVGRREDVAALKKARTGVKGAGWKRDFRELIETLAARP